MLLATIVKVQELVNVWIVCPPLVVIVPPVDVGETPSLPSVAYEIITTHFHPVHPIHQFQLPPHPPPSQSVQLEAVPLIIAPLPPQPVHPEPAVHKVACTPQPPHQAYVTAVQDILLLVPLPQFPPTLDGFVTLHPALELHPPQPLG